MEHSKSKQSLSGENMKCDECGGKVIVKKVDYELLGVPLGKFVAEVCTSCGEQLFSEEESHKITHTAKAKGLWGLCARTSIGKVGNSFDVKIARNIVDFMGLTKGREVIVHPESRRKLVIEVS